MLANLSAGDALQHRVRIAELFAFQVSLVAETFLCKFVLKLRKQAQFVQKPAVNRRNLRNLVCRNAALERLEHHEQPLVVAVFQQRANLVVGEFA